MAQKREKEETELKVPETIPVRTPSLPVTSPPQLSTTAEDQKPPSQSISSVKPPEISDPKVSSTEDVRSGETERKAAAAEEEEMEDSRKRRREVNRCSGIGCRRKVGLIGFRCRCGEVFCSEHRYSDRHDCSFDYKSAGREAIARENPVVRAAKILKI